MGFDSTFLQQQHCKDNHSKFLIDTIIPFFVNFVQLFKINDLTFSPCFFSRLVTVLSLALVEFDIKDRSTVSQSDGCLEL